MRRILLMSGIVVFISSFNIWDDFVVQLKEKMATYQRIQPQEKVYVHTDRPIYKPGETLWLKAYVVDGLSHQPTTLSEIVHIILIDPKGQPVVEKKAIVTEGTAEGNIKLSSDLPGGIYKLRVYTRYQRNLGEDTFFEKDIIVQKVVNPQLLLQLNFAQKSYRAGDEVVAKVAVKDLENEPIAQKENLYRLTINGEAFQNQLFTTDGKGKATVRFYLPDTLTTTDVVLNVIVRANGVRESIARTVPITLDNIHINFYPEGGQAVTGLENRIAFKAVNEWGKPAEVVGVVLDKNNNTVVKFKSFYAGMGAFSFTPQPNERYRVQLEGVRSNQSFSLPTFERKGWLLKAVNTEKEWLQVQIQTTHQADQALLVAQVRGKIYHHQEVQLSEGKATCKVPTAQLPAGVVQLTLFDKAHLPQCERLAFVNPHKTLNIKLTTDKKSYHPREQVTLKVQTTNENGRPVSANLSLSVANDKLLKLADDKQDHLLSYLLLSSEVKGEIHEPTFYFKQDEPRAAKALDYLLMTQGWRRFTWQKLLTEAPSPTHLPEKVGNLNGQLLDHQEKPVKGKVWLFELENAKRAIAVETTPQGEFTFVGVDPTSSLQLVATNRKGKAINGKIVIKGWNQPEEKIALTPIGEALSPIPTTLGVQTPRQSRARQYTRSVLKAQAMSEVVVTAQAQSTILQGQLAGVYITRQEEDFVAASNLREVLDESTVGINTNGSTGENSALTIRGTSTLSTQAPLMIIDGMPMEGNLGDFSPDDVDNIAVIKGAAATALYGTRAANGAIVITTKRGVTFGSETPYRYMQRLVTQFVAAREFAKVPTFEAPDYVNDPSPKQRTDFRSTIFWRGNITTDAQGEATVQFYNSDEETTFQITAEGISKQGLVGRTTHFYAVQRLFSLTPTLPPFLSYGDVIDIPVLIKNNTEKNIKGTLSLQVPSAFKALKLPAEELTISARTTQMYYARYKVLYQAAGKTSIKIGFKGKSRKFSDAYVHPIEILPKGFPVSLAYHTNRHKAAIKADIRSLVPNSLKAYFVVYPSALGDLVASIKGIFRAPHGCFEQTSSATYPNVMALLLLEQLKETDVALKQQALQYIKQGYKRLTSFETKENGFEWFGRTPPHLGLTAYGLLEFTDMKKVYPAVSEPMLKRTKQWLLDQRDGNGGFKTTYQKYSWGTQTTNNAAYALYALSEAGVHTIEKEFEQSWAEALTSRSAYRLALMANVAYNLGQTTKGEKALQLLEELIQFYGEEALPDAGYTVVGSRGDDYRLQVYALMGLALLKQETSALARLNPINTFLLKHKKLGRYGSTQSTVLCLKFITAFQHITKSEFPDGTFQVALDQKAIPVSYQAKALKAIEQPLADYLLVGKQLIQVTANNTEVPNWGVNIQYHTFEPQSNEHCEIDLTTKLYQANTQVGEIVRLAVKVKNREKADQPMSVAVVGIPAGLSFQPWQLKEFKEKKVADYIEIFDNYLVFYFTGLKAQEEKHILLDLKASIPGTYTAPASSAYLYYNDAEKTWRAGTKITIVAPTK